jgi:hypothetical protein
LCLSISLQASSLRMIGEVGGMQHFVLHDPHHAHPYNEWKIE